MEATGHFHQTLAAHLSDVHDVVVRLVNPAAVSAVKAQLNRRRKTDWLDAAAICELLRGGEVRAARRTWTNKELVRDRLSAILGPDAVDAAHDRVQAAALAEGNTRLTSTPAGIGIAVTDRPDPALTRRSPNAWRVR